MDWLSLLAGAAVGALAGLLVQNIFYPLASARLQKSRMRKQVKATNEALKRLRKQFSRLQLVQSGWDYDGTFADESVRITKVGGYSLPRRLVGLRDSHVAGWEAAKLFNGKQVGIYSFAIRRVSDDPVSDLGGSSHLIDIQAHEYDFFDYLVTHNLRLDGNNNEKSLIEELTPAPKDEGPVHGFPTPLSVGLSLLCENGDTLFIPRRKPDSYWEGGSIFNAVGEGATIRDFTRSHDGHSRSSPAVIALRGLHEEMGFTDADARAAILRIHSFARATDLLDYKFFGYAISPLSRMEIFSRWESARDRYESIAPDTAFVDISSRRASRKLLEQVRDTQKDWSPEALFCTIRTLLILHKLSPRDLLEVLG